MNIQDLPTDILLIIISRLDIADILALQQISRDLHAYFSSAAWVWQALVRSLSPPLPLSRPLSTYGAPELQQSLRRAFQLDRNWRAERPHVHAFGSTNLPEDVSVEDLRLTYGGEYAVATQRNRRLGKTGATLTVLCLRETDSIWTMASIEVHGEYRKLDIDLSSMDENGVQLLRTVMSTCVSGVETLLIYTFTLDPTTTRHGAPIVPSFRAIQKPEGLPGIFNSVALHEDVVAASISATVEQQIVMLHDLRTHHHQLFVPFTQDNQAGLSVYLSSTRLFVLQSYANEVALSGALHHSCTHPVSDLSVISKAVPGSCGFAHLGLSSSREGTAEDRVTLYVFPNSIWHSDGFMQATMVSFGRLSAEPGRQQTSTTRELKSVFAPRIFSSFASLMSPGVYRAVCVVNDWESGGDSVMKSFCGSTLRIAELLPPEPQLPVRPVHVRALAFDEASGRLCMGLYTGRVALVDYGPRERQTR